MKFYRIQGESGWYSWEDLHNLYGYTETPSLSLQYKSAASETWGEYAASGYSDNAFEDLAACSYFVSGEGGWGSLNSLATILHLYPAVCTDGPNVTNGVVTSPTATYNFDGETFYLIRDDVAHGWIAGADLSAYGWEIEDQTSYELLFFDTTTGKVTYGVESLNELVSVEAGYFTTDGADDVVFVEQSQFPIVCTYMESMASQSVAPDDGFATGLPYYASKLYSVQTSDGVDVTRSGWEAGEEPVDPGYIDVLLGLRYDPPNTAWKTVAFDQTPLSEDNYWWACVLTQADADALQAFGVTYHDPSSIWGGVKYTGPIGNVVYDSDYSYEFLALYSDMGETEVAQDIWSVITLDYLVRDNHGLLVIWDKIINSSTPVKTWKCRITRNSQGA